jgi:hypothetical protein
MCFLSPRWINKTLILPMQFHQIYMVASTLFPPCSIANIFGNWHNGNDHRFKKHIRMGAIAFIWSLWLCRNDKVFNDRNSSILQITYRGICTLHLWSSLQWVEDQDLFICARLKATARDTFPNMVPHSLRIGSSEAWLQLFSMICNFTFYFFYMIHTGFGLCAS